VRDGSDADLRTRLLAVPRSLRPTSPAQFIVAAFLVVVAAGTAALMVPLARAGRGGAGLLEALFTATSAVSVTGLTVVDTADHWTPLGHVVILVLIQIGGLGIMTSASLLGLLTLRRFGMSTRISALEESRSIGPGDLRSVLASVVRISLVIEAVVAVLLAVRLAAGYGEPPLRAAWLGVFHAVSAFNSAGFALYPDSLEGFAGDPLFLLPLGAAVVLGSLGFPVLLELSRELRHPRRWSLNTVLVVWAGGILLALASLVTTVLEWENPATLGPLSTGRKLFAGAFETIVPRSAGFTTEPIADLDRGTWLVLDALMFIGSGPAGTGGGIKLTTAAVLFFVIYAEARGDSAVNAFGRRIPRSVHRQAISVVLLATGAVGVSTLALTLISRAPLEEVLFEVISAFATVGLSTGLTAELPPAGHVLLVVLMLVGRLGPITVATALALNRRSRLYQLPEERPIIG